ncbi:MAG: hypothetical protein IPP71_23945 [Bacteroidetes bacterium]|nr:hypothetical protein [Bacteroidota bacterium]
MLTCFVKPASGSNDYGITAIIQPTCSAAVPGTLHPVIVVITNFWNHLADKYSCQLYCIWKHSDHSNI